ncbi:hypothetical protein NDA18_003399 [Ustilago nuda]|nr:hypothetical protein NDA18_003399 [Ustilago nuda]
MRHASQLCRGLAEAARSLERPYVPRHVPLPSSSYSTQAQQSPTPIAPKPSTDHISNRSEESSAHDGAQNDRVTKRITALHSNPTHQRSQQNSPQPSPSPPPIDRQRHQSSDSSHTLSTSQLWDAAASAKPKTPTEPQQSSTGAFNKSFVKTAARTYAGASPQGQASAMRKIFNDADQRGLHLELDRTARKVELLMVAYPRLSKPQANLLLQTFRQIHAFRSQAPTALLSWYEDLVWTTERQTQGLEQIESSQSLSLLLRYVYQKNDLRSLLRLESRAARMSRTLQQLSGPVAETRLLPKKLGNYEVDGVGIWPESRENPCRLAFNLKVAYAAKEGNWIKVDEYVSQAGLLSNKVTLGKEKSRSRSDLMLDTIGWGCLLRFGLAAVRQSDSRKRRDTQARPAEGETYQPTVPSTISDTTTTLLEGIADEEKARQIQQQEAQAQAKLSLTKRLLPHLLRHTRSALKHSSDTAGDPNSEDPATPAWLLQSVLTQLAERGDTATTMRIVQLALSEISTLDQHALVRGGATSILNLTLIACHQNRAVSLTETLRIFNNLTGSTLGQRVNDPASVASKLRETEADGASIQGSERQTKGRKIVPNEESLVLMLKKVRHPLFRAAWTRKLVQDFQRLFPKVRLTGRTYRMIIDQCVAPAPVLQPRPEEAVSEDAPAATEHMVASGRRGRHLRQAASSTKSSSSTPPTSSTTALSATRGPIIKQSILANTLQDILNRFQPTHPTSYLHLSTTNRRRFEHTLLRALRLLNPKRDYHLQKLKEGAKQGLVKHHSAAVEDIVRIIGLIAQVKRLGRMEEERRKTSQAKNAVVD